MIVPKSFSLFGETYKVKQVVKVDKEDSWGGYFPELGNVIKIKKALSEEQKEQTYLHEITHCILDNLGYESLHRDETLVDTFSKALHQILKTSK